MTLYCALIGCALNSALYDSYLDLDCHIDMYSAMLERDLLVQWDGVPGSAVDFLNRDLTVVDDTNDPRFPGVCINGRTWRSLGYMNFPMERLVKDGFLQPAAGQVQVPKPVPVVVDNRRNDGPCPVCGTRTEKFSCFTSVSYICPQCKS